MSNLRDLMKAFTIIVTILFLLVVAGVKENQFDNLTFDEGVKAAFFALASAASLIIIWIPQSKSRAGKDVHWVARLVPALSAGLAAWFWLSKETGGNPMPYVIEVSILFGMLLAAIVVSHLAIFIIIVLRNWIARRNI